MHHGGAAAPVGDLGLKVIRSDGSIETPAMTRRAARAVELASHYPARELSLREVVLYGLPRDGLDPRVNDWRTKNIRNLLRGARRVMIARAAGISQIYGALYLTHIKADGEVLELGLASMRVVTTAGANFLVDALQGSVEPELLKFHGLGTGTNAEATGDTALQTEITTQYNPDNTRATGNQGEGASANVYRTIGTNTVDAAVANTEHGIFSQAATGGGTLLDRSVYSVVNLANGDSLQSTYDFTVAAGS
jgi:hypothetical protein